MLLASNVLISGANPPSVAIAKRLVLEGVRSLTLHNREVADWERFIGQIISVVPEARTLGWKDTLRQLSLNKYVQITTLPGPLQNLNLSTFQVVILTDARAADATVVGEYCQNHDPPIEFVWCALGGPLCSLFCDLFDPAPAPALAPAPVPAGLPRNVDRAKQIFRVSMAGFAPADHILLVQNLLPAEIQSILQGEGVHMLEGPPITAEVGRALTELSNYMSWWPVDERALMNLSMTEEEKCVEFLELNLERGINIERGWDEQ